MFNLDPVRVPQKYPGKKHFKGPKAGQYFCNPLSKNPGEVWDTPNVKNNHVEKTFHPCQFPVEPIGRLVLSMTNPGDWVPDPFLGVGTSIVAAVRRRRHGAGAKIAEDCVKLAKKRIAAAMTGRLPASPMGKPKYELDAAGQRLRQAPGRDLAPSASSPVQYPLLELETAVREK